MKTCPLCDTGYPNHKTTCDTDGALLIESRDLEPGRVIRGKYRVVRLLGHGGMGTVYLAEHILLGQQRALKFISSELSQDARFLKRFRHEAQAAIKLRHPNVVEVVDLDQAEDGSPYIAMEYVEGEDLRHALAAGAFPVERALAIARGVALGLAAAHAKGIVHRDVKPENVLLAGGNGAPETPKLLDFGIAAIQESATAISHTRGLLLTPPYAAPEQWQGMPSGQLDGRADLYALGGVLYEMLTGQTTFRAHNTEGWMHKHLHVEPQPPSSLRPELANLSGIDALVLRLLAKDREQRPRDAAELIGLLDAVRFLPPDAHRETVSEDTVRVGKQAKIDRQKRISILVSGASVVAILAATLAVWLGSQRFRQLRPPGTLAAGAKEHDTKSPIPKSEGVDNCPLCDYESIARKYGGTYTPPKEITLPVGAGGIDSAVTEQKAEYLYDNGHYLLAAPLFDKACKGGNFYGCYNLGRMYERGPGLVLDHAKAVQLWTKACEVGSPDGCNDLGALYEDGRGVKLDYRRAAELFLKACNENEMLGCVNLANMYLHGRGVAKDAQKAKDLLKNDCAKGSERESCNELRKLD